jgi:hypothetical protein
MRSFNTTYLARKVAALIVAATALISSVSEFCRHLPVHGLHSNTHIWGGAVLVGLLVVGIVSLLNYYKDAQPFNNPIARASFYMAWAACLICINSFGWASAGWLGVGGGTIILILIACSSRSTQPQAQLPSGR